eukprot:PhF_6_TR9695/c0_g1_i1/m.14919
MSLISCFRGVLVGSGSDGLSKDIIANAILSLVPTDRCSMSSSEMPPTVVYLGTATYDLPGPRSRQTSLLQAKGCTVIPLDVAYPKTTPPLNHIQSTMEGADIIIVSGGNTLYALRRWKECGIDVMLREACQRGCVLAGGSAGAICWFDGGHSDSMDPDTYRTAMTTDDKQQGNGSEQKKAWEYIRVTGLGFLPGLACPHYDRTQSNGILRKDSYREMLRLNPGEYGIALDHWAALVLDQGKYEVVSVPLQTGSGPSGCAISVCCGTRWGGCDSVTENRYC